MDGFVAGLFSVAALLVGATIVTTLVKNGSGTASVISSATSGFANVLNAAQGNSTFGVTSGSIG